jgi:hypothetical protein
MSIDIMRRLNKMEIKAVWNASAIVMVLTSANMFGQAMAPFHTSGNSLPPTGVMIVQISTAEPVISLRQLVMSADLIVAGQVSSLSPPVNVNSAGSTPLVETRSVISISEVFSTKKLPDGTTSIVLTQTGGKFGGWNYISNDAPLVAVGEQYILFLHLDSRKSSESLSNGVPLYDVVGVWSGLLRVQDSKVAFLPSAASTLHESDNTDIVTFGAQLRDLIKECANVIVVPPWFRLGPGVTAENIQEVIKAGPPKP